jgi:hypothetical protein
MLSGAALDVRALPDLAIGGSGAGGRPGGGGGGSLARVMVLNNSASDLSALLAALERQHLALFMVESQLEYDDILGVCVFRGGPMCVCDT